VCEGVGVGVEVGLSGVWGARVRGHCVRARGRARPGGGVGKGGAAAARHAPACSPALTCEPSTACSLRPMKALKGPSAARPGRPPRCCSTLATLLGAAPPASREVLRRAASWLAASMLRAAEWPALTTSCSSLARGWEWALRGRGTAAAASRGSTTTDTLAPTSRASKASRAAASRARRTLEELDGITVQGYPPPQEGRNSIFSHKL
jgi:hypothetical protein